MSEEMFNYVLDCIEFIVEEGYKLLPLYLFYSETGEWVHRERKVLKGKKWIGGVSYKEGIMNYPKNDKELVESSFDYTSYLEEAKKIVKNSVELFKKKQIVSDVTLEESDLRWFVLPHEVYYELINQLEVVNNNNYSLTNSPFRTSNLIDKLKYSGSIVSGQLSEPLTIIQREEDMVCGISKIILPEESERKLHKIPKNIRSPFQKALMEFQMIKPDDKVLVCGKIVYFRICFYQNFIF